MAAMKFFLFCLVSIFNQKAFVSAFQSDQVLWAFPRSDKEADILRNLTTAFEIVLWQPVSPENIIKNKEVHFYVNVSDVNNVKAELNRSAILFRVSLEDVHRIIGLQTAEDTVTPRSSSSFYEQYHSLKVIYSWMDEIAAGRPDIIQKIHIGNSFEKRPLYVLKLSHRNRTSKNAIWIDCGIHAREWISPACCLWFIGHNRMWRKSRSQHGDNRCIGTDMNRNFDAGWCGKGASRDGCQETYCGPYPESEPEVKAVVNFLRKHKDHIKAYITMHSYSQMVLFPYSYTKNKSKDHDELQSVANQVAMAIRNAHHNHYVTGSGAQTIYLAPGGSDDWAYDHGIKYSFTFELRDKGRYGFLLPQNLIKLTCYEALTGIKTIALHVLQHM
ncbi:carboxypeptidase B2 isoform X2 [Candoia aspera]|uniref:carboxypeptidase B2 isoform X2 n=1 Tax=Candoia aspera TaxID=51853 RepID=UPI002FD83C93